LSPASRRHGLRTHSPSLAANRSRGPSVYANGRTISQRKVTTAVVAALRDQLARPDLLNRFVESFSKHFDEAKRGATAHVREAEQHVERISGRVKNVTAAMAAADFSEALLAQLREEETALAAAKTRLAAAADETRPKILPHPRVIQSYVSRLLEADPARARELLARHMPPLVLAPEGRSYRMTGGFNLSVPLDNGATGEPEAMISRVGGTPYPTNRRPPMWLEIRVLIA
jgi:hypothetical protein